MATQFCPHCGKPLTAPGAPFCSYCGRPVVMQAPLPGASAEGPSQPLYGAQYPAFAAPAAAKLGFSTARGVWCAIGVIVAAMGVSGVVASLIFASNQNIEVAYASNSLVLPVAAVAGPIAYWLALVRLPIRPTERVVFEAIGFTLAVSLICVVCNLVLFQLFNLPQFMIDPHFNNIFNGSTFWMSNLLAAIAGGSVGGAAGWMFALVFARWPAVRVRITTGNARSRLMQILAGVAAAYLALLAPTLAAALFGASTSVTQFSIAGEVSLSIGGPVIVVALVWYATWSTLRVLRQAAPVLVP